MFANPPVFIRLLPFYELLLKLLEVNLVLSLLLYWVLIAYFILLVLFHLLLVLFSRIQVHSIDDIVVYYPNFILVIGCHWFSGVSPTWLIVIIINILLLLFISKVDGLLFAFAIDLLLLNNRLLWLVDSCYALLLRRNGLFLRNICYLDRDWLYLLLLGWGLGGLDFSLLTMFVFMLALHRQQYSLSK